jgi:hypothetical protein
MFSGVAFFFFFSTRIFSIQNCNSTVPEALDSEGRQCKPEVGGVSHTVDLGEREDGDSQPHCLFCKP